MSETAPTGTSAASLTTRADAGEGKAGTVSLWLQAIDLASKQEADWRKRAEEVVKLYRGEGKRQKKFNILFSNVETLAPATYNSPPVPDVRRRFSEADPISKAAALIIERALTFSIEHHGFDNVLRRSVKEVLIAGRGVARVKYEPTFDDAAEDAEPTVLDELTRTETVSWQDFRHGPAKVWSDVPWVAFRHYLTRAELTRLSPRIGPQVELDARVPGMGEDTDADGPPPDLFRRATVWEVWDKEKRQVVFVAKSWPDAPIETVDDPLGLADFFPVPQPVYALESPDDLIPVEPYRLYKDLADELDVISRRITALTSAMKWRGAYSDPTLGDFLSKFTELKDGEMAPVENPISMNGGKLTDAFWFMPLEELAKVLAQLYASRDQVKQAIYEITGISDIVRGATKATETASAQQLKSQWGNLRIQHLQAEVARFARDLLRLEAEIIAEKFAPETLFAISGVELPSEAELLAEVQKGLQGQPMSPEQQKVFEQTPTQENVIALLRDDASRRFRIDIETDSTIRADVARAQENIGQFVQGFGAFIAAVGPAVQAGAMPMPVVAEMVKSFSRVFKLGRSVEDALEAMPTEQPPQADPAAAEQAAQQAEMQREQMKLQAEQQAQAGEMQVRAAEAQAAQQQATDKLQADMQIEQMRLQAQMQTEAARMQAESQRHAETIAFEREKYAIEVELRQAEMQQSAAIQREKNAMDAEAKREATATSYAVKSEATQAAAKFKGSKA
jgi:hypothetical protein